MRKKKPTVIRNSDEAIQLLEKEDWIALDLETGGLSPYKDPIGVVSLYGPDSNIAAILHVRGYLEDNLVRFLSDSKRKIITHNGVGFDYLFLANNGVDVFAPELYDTMVSESCHLSSGRNNNGVSLKATAERRLGVELDKSLQKSTWMGPELSPAQVEYCVGDITYLHPIKRQQFDSLASSELFKRAVGIETALLKPVLKMELAGLPIDRGELNKYLSILEMKSVQAKKEIEEVWGNVNLNSPAQVKKAFLELGQNLKSTDADTMKELSHYPTKAGQMAQLMIDYKSNTRNLLYYDNDWWNKFVINGVVHCKYNQNMTDTGRFSSSEPNLQNVPTHMRHIFGNIPGKKMAVADYSQIEVRILAGLANETTMLAAFATEDIHRFIGSQIFDVAPDQVTKEQRQLSKALVFTLCFAGGAETFMNHAASAGATIGLWDAKKIIKIFFERFPKLNELKAQAIAMCSGRNVTLQLPTGQKRTLFGASASPTTILNTSAQGTAAAGLKIGLIKAYNRGLTFNETVHDEVGKCGLDENEVDDWFEAVNDAMIGGMSQVTKAPLKMELQVGDSWSKIET